MRDPGSVWESDVFTFSTKTILPGKEFVIQRSSMSGEIEARKNRRNLKNRREKRSHLQELEKQEYEQEKQSLGFTSNESTQKVVDQPKPSSFCTRCIRITIAFVMTIMLVCVMVGLGIHFFCGRNAHPELSESLIWCDKIRVLCLQSVELFPKLKMVLPDCFMEVDEPKVEMKIIQPLCDAKDFDDCSPNILK